SRRMPGPSVLGFGARNSSKVNDACGQVGQSTAPSAGEQKNPPWRRVFVEHFKKVRQPGRWTPACAGVKHWQSRARCARSACFRNKKPAVMGGFLLTLS